MSGGSKPPLKYVRWVQAPPPLKYVRWVQAPPLNYVKWVQAPPPDGIGLKGTVVGITTVL